MLGIVKNKGSEALENTLLGISSLNWLHSVMKAFLNNFLENLNLLL